MNKVNPTRYYYRNISAFRFLCLCFRKSKQEFLEKKIIEDGIEELEKISISSVRWKEIENVVMNLRYSNKQKWLIMMNFWKIKFWSYTRYKTKNTRNIETIYVKSSRTKLWKRLENSVRFKKDIMHVMPRIIIISSQKKNGLRKSLKKN